MNMMKMLKQAQAMQEKMQQVQADLGQREVEFSAGGGVVTAVARGDGSVARIRIDPKVVDPADVGMLEDLVLAAVDGALTRAREMMSEEMGKVTKPLGIPGLNLPF
jgi:nucleoid-associated protein EbfC